MKKLKKLFDNNAQWVAEQLDADPDFFAHLSKTQKPKYLYIGCSDSRIPANDILGLLPGDLFVHRNVANLVMHTDFNSLSVIQYAVNCLEVEHVIICGHYGCGGIKAAMDKTQLGIIDNWLGAVRDIAAQHHDELEALDESARYQRLVELNVLHQVNNFCHNTIPQNAWQRGQALSVHGWVYSLEDGLLRDLNCCISSVDQIQEAYRLTLPDC